MWIHSLWSDCGTEILLFTVLNILQYNMLDVLFYSVSILFEHTLLEVENIIHFQDTCNFLYWYIMI